ncbi:MAG: PA2778 family cysteine peptidase [Moraxellaceae bacterium]|nr:PA2778 family cysteine peptidase [Moraxellaceae bacterium]
MKGFIQQTVNGTGAEAMVENLSVHDGAVRKTARMTLSQWAGLVLLGSGVFLGGCVAPQTKAWRAAVAAAPESAITAPLQVPDVPFFPQADYQCGPAALATLMAWSGKVVTPDELVAQVYVPGRRGSYALEMIVTARRNGRLVYPVAGNLPMLLTVLEQGYPVLVLQNNGLGIYPLWHFAVVVGADPAREKITLRSGRTENLVMDFSVFERTWARGDHWAALLLDPARLPDTLEPGTVIRELALMEKAGAVVEAQAGFSRAVLNWPEQKTAWLGLANTSLALNEKARAESTLRELVRRQPQYGPGLNNLADVLLKSGRAAEALPYAERAVAVLDIPVTRTTLAAVRAALAPDAAVVEVPPVHPDVSEK